MTTTILRTALAAALALGAAVVATPAFAQTQHQYDRIDTITRYALASPICERVGFTVDEPGLSSVDRQIVTETVASGLSAEVADKLVLQAMNRQLGLMRIDLDTLSKQIDVSPNMAAEIRAMFYRRGKECVAAAGDVLLSQYITAPPGYDLTAAVTKATDELVYVGGMASWQTPRIQARGDLVSLASACRGNIGPERSDAMIKAYSRTDDPRERQYYSESVQVGMSSSDLRGLDKTQCERAIKSFSAKAGTP